MIGSSSYSQKANIEILNAFKDSLDYICENNIYWNSVTLERMVRKRLSKNTKKRFENIIKFESKWILNWLREEDILKGGENAK